MNMVSFEMAYGLCRLILVGMEASMEVMKPYLTE